MNERKRTYLVFFAKQTDDRSQYEIYISGKKTGMMVSKAEIMRLLTHAQYESFEAGESIFELSKSSVSPYLKEQKPDDPKKRWPVQ